MVVHNLASSPCMHALYLPGYPGFPVLQKSRIQVNEYQPFNLKLLLNKNLNDNLLNNVL